MSFPIERPRRLRRTQRLRDLVRETIVTPNDLVQPMFVVPGSGIKKEISSLKGQFHFSVDMAVEEAKDIAANGVPAIILFGIPSYRDATGSSAWDENGEVQQAVTAIKKAVPELLVITDVCLCEYTDHGHCGMIHEQQVNNDPTLELLARTAVSHAKAGADIVAPSDMMDGRVGAIRSALDANNFTDIPILSYAVKYASAYYGPFREAAGSAPQFGDRSGYQMDPANVLEAIREAELDIDEGADMLMVKPGMVYLDVLSKVKETFGRVTAVYHVSGEYAMIEAAAEKGWIDRKRLILETLLAFKRAGADFILTYHAKEAAGWLK
ncbi:porphobilinogen synthase [bacterium]|nr:porphobilinogen synthase [bacterium]